MTTNITPTECRILSTLAKTSEANPTDLAKLSKVPRPTLYVLLRRMARNKLVRSERDGTHVPYAITASGKKARADFAKSIGLTAP